MTEAVPLTDAELDEWRELLSLPSVKGPKAEYLAHHRRVLATIDKDRQEIAALREKLARAREAFSETRLFLAALVMWCKEGPGKIMFGKTAGKIGDDAQAVLDKCSEVHALLSTAEKEGGGE